MKIILVIFAISAVLAASSGRQSEDDAKETLDSVIGTNQKVKGRAGRLFSLFSVVTFKQTPCTLSSENSHMGTCMTSSECVSKGGSKDGNCASGFGVCCAFTVNTCPGTVNQNCTYVTNPEYPAATTESSCSITFNRICNNLCQIRLDFETLTTAQPIIMGTDIVGLCGSTNTDTVTAMSPTGVNPPVICGDLSGQHMFIETGRTGGAGKLDLSFGSVTSNRVYQFKVTYYTCDSLNKAPTDCVQYFTGTSGTIQSYNWPNQIPADSDYASCIRQEEGYCGVVYQQSISTSDTFKLYGGAAADDTVIAAAELTGCLQTFIAIPNLVSNTVLPVNMGTNRFCGDLFSYLQGATEPGQVQASGAPFLIQTFTLATLGANAAADNIGGYSLDYSLKPCGQSTST